MKFYRCPVQVALNYIEKKWALNIIRDAFQGKKRFTEFLNANPGMSTKMLSRRLKELQQAGLLDKAIINKTPMLIEYHLTPRRLALNKVIYELSVFSIEYLTGEVFSVIPDNFEPAKREASSRFGLTEISV